MVRSHRSISFNHVVSTPPASLGSVICSPSTHHPRYSLELRQTYRPRNSRFYVLNKSLLPLFRKCCFSQFLNEFSPLSIMGDPSLQRGQPEQTLGSPVDAVSMLAVSYCSYPTFSKGMSHSTRLFLLLSHVWQPQASKKTEE